MNYWYWVGYEEGKYGKQYNPPINFEDCYDYNNGYEDGEYDAYIEIKFKVLNDEKK